MNNISSSPVYVFVYIPEEYWIDGWSEEWLSLLSEPEEREIVRVVANRHREAADLKSWGLSQTGAVLMTDSLISLVSDLPLLKVLEILHEMILKGVWSYTTVDSDPGMAPFLLSPRNPRRVQPPGDRPEP